ncbi:MAG: DUF3307 domain-containing protein [Parvibaculum sp.]|uniref:DUF3307 domain-containing protein n=1 Tax=Parvibaculum sp. TaxID=2024848 RepID=UPI00284EEAB3|nr:DUF3307 domain-containing protein [Parvibaculum sp.]MDR3500184.1 DUF3307 domain-containing protein [Parvibaculum sp.]
MNEPFPLLFAALALLQAKHFLFDFVFQTKYQLKNKGTYGHPGGLLHAGLHAAGSLPAILLFQPSATLIASIVIGEFAVHYHVDWLKERAMKRNGWKVEDNGFWIALGADQLAHHLTYTAILIALTVF